MAIKIINTTPSPLVVKQVVCIDCGVTLEFTPSDTREEKRTDYTGDTDFYRVIDCPNCKRKITIR